MQVKRIGNGANEKLTVIVLGWACGPELVSDIRPRDTDLIVIYDHRGMEGLISGDPSPAMAELKSILLGHRSRMLAAWSFGVWVAEMILGDIPFDGAVAFNGTPFPAHEEFGIGARRLAVTLRGLSKGGMDTFLSKAYGPWYGRAVESLEADPGRNERDYIAELDELTRLSAGVYSPRIDWSEALVGSRDEIFPPENMLRYWGSRSKDVNLPHFPFGDEEILRRYIETR